MSQQVNVWVRGCRCLYLFLPKKEENGAALAQTYGKSGPIIKCSEQGFRPCSLAGRNAASPGNADARRKVGRNKLPLSESY
jgi:hypothetical protein